MLTPRLLPIADENSIFTMLACKNSYIFSIIKILIKIIIKILSIIKMSKLKLSKILCIVVKFVPTFSKKYTEYVLKIISFYINFYMSKLLLG